MLLYLNCRLRWYRLQGDQAGTNVMMIARKKKASGMIKTVNEVENLFFAWRSHVRRELFLFRQKYKFAFTGLLISSMCVVVMFWTLRSTLLYGYSAIPFNDLPSFSPLYQSLLLLATACLSAGIVYTMRKYFDFYKRLFDLSVSAFVLLLLFPLFLIIAIMVKVDSKGPVFFRQERIGKKGRPFTILKFRSMRQNAEMETGAVWAQEDDPRITRLGRFLRKSHLDELPQFINVFRGDMSIVGPRPERSEMISVILKDIPDFNRRLLVKPGITGLAQVRYNYGATIKDAARKLKFDKIYIRRKCWLIDFQIMFWTAQRMLTGEGAR